MDAAIIRSYGIVWRKQSINVDNGETGCLGRGDKASPCHDRYIVLMALFEYYAKITFVGYSKLDS